ncbi:MAG TPA: SIR2 family protein, partial [Gemmata sp.]
MAFNTLRSVDLFERVNRCCVVSAGEPPPFTLILGSGFSYGIIPTTAQIVREDLPWWLWCQRKEKGGPTPDDYRNRKEADFATQAKDESRTFWSRVSATYASGSRSPLALGADGLPEGEAIGEAYRFALSAGCGSGLSSPHQVRRYFGDIIRRIGRRLNPAHLFLASLIAERPRLFGTIFTTNFDPLLQRSLQLVNAPYYVSDRPDTMQHADDDDIAEAVHVVHAHGSIYRYLLVNSPAEIESYATRNRDKLQEYFRSHAVLIVGFSGWDDAITRALAGVDQFAHNLYWTDRGTDPEKSNLTVQAKEILKRHHNAFYVPIGSADELMAQMHQHLLGHSLPKLFREPILVAQGQLDLCDLTGVKLPASTTPPTPTASDGSARTASAAGSADQLDLGEQVKAVRKRLDDAQDLFTGRTSTDPAALLAAEVR